MRWKYYTLFIRDTESPFEDIRDHLNGHPGHELIAWRRERTGLFYALCREPQE